MDRFERDEKRALLPLPPTRFESVTWKQAKAHSDCHVNFEYAYYSVPFRLVGQTLLVRATPWRVEIYDPRSHERVASHARAGHRGQRMSTVDHMPPEKLRGLLPPRPQMLLQAEKIGPYAREVIERLLAERPVDRVRAAQGILGLLGRLGASASASASLNGVGVVTVTPARLEAACKRAVVFDDVRYRTIRDILKRGLDLEPVNDPADAPAPLPKTALFARQAWEMQPQPRPRPKLNLNPSL